MSDTEDAGTPTGDHLTATYRRLNSDFYAADPADYFHVRWLALMLLAGRPDETLSLFGEGITVGHVHAKLEDPQTDAEGVRDFATMESQILLHQACETLLRLYLAHVGRPPCPWLDLSGETSFAHFKKRVRSEILTADIDQPVADVFLGGAKEAFNGLGDEGWADAVRNLTSFLRTFADRWLEEAHAYNSLKHGLAVLPSAVQLSFAAEGDPLEQARLLAQGPSLDFLECTPWEGGRRSWRRTTTWIDVSESLAFTDVARSMIASLWEIARMRYTDVDRSGKIFLPRDLRPGMLRSPDRSPGHRWSMSLGLDEIK